MHKPGPAMAVATLALFVVLGGGAAVAGTLVTSAQIQNHTIQLQDLSRSTINALKGQRGLPGAAGPAGPAGLDGGFDPSKLQYVTGPEYGVAPGYTQAAQVYCPAGSKAISGGYILISGGGGTVWGSDSFDSGASWTIFADNFYGAVLADFKSYAVCAAA
jgi:hypothetical protein